MIDPVPHSAIGNRKSPLPPAPPRWLPLTQAAAIAAVHHGTLRRAADAGELRHRRLPGAGCRIEIDAGDLQRWAEVSTRRKKKVLEKLDAETRDTRAGVDLVIQNRWKRKRPYNPPPLGPLLRSAGERIRRQSSRKS